MDPIQAIDVHGHYGSYIRQQSPLIDRWCSGAAAQVAARARRAGIRLTAVSPLLGLLPRGEADAVEGNREAAEAVPVTEGLLQWVVLNPLQPATFEQATDMLAQPQCIGIKLHPEEHQYPIREYGRVLFEFAARHDALVLVHSGDPYSLPADFLPWADTFDNIKVVLAHLGNGGGAAGDPTLQVRAIQRARNGNVYTDSSSARSILPGLIEWAVGEIGAERILFGTDTPLYSAAVQRARIDSAAISETDRRRILCGNAEELLGPAAV